MDNETLIKMIELLSSAPTLALAYVAIWYLFKELKTARDRYTDHLEFYHEKKRPDDEQTTK